MRWTALAVVFLTGCASTPMTRPAPVSVNVVALSPLQSHDAELFSRIAREYVNRYARNGQPLTVTITLTQGADILAGRDAVTAGGYYALVQPNAMTSGHRVPLVGGQTAAEVGFMPTVGTGGGSMSGGSTPIYFDDGIFAVYTIADAAGRVLEKENIPLAFPAMHLQQYHDAAMFIAKRVARQR